MASCRNQLNLVRFRAFPGIQLACECLPIASIMRAMRRMAFLLLGLFACSKPTPPPIVQRFKGSDQRIVGLGRTDRATPDVLRFSWPASGFTFRFRGQGVRVQLTDTVYPDETRANDWIRVSIDGRPAESLELAQGSHWVAFAQGLSNAAHTLRVEKRTEAEVGSITLQSVELDPTGELLAPPEEPPFSIVAIGDSITAGFGLEGAEPTCRFSARTENALDTYTALAANQLHARYEAVAWSGKGVFQNDDVRDLEPLPSLYERSLAESPNTIWRHDASTDVVVVNLGTNDYAHGDVPQPLVVADYSRLLQRVRITHPRAFIALMLGPMLYDEGRIQSRSSARRAIQAVIEERRAVHDTNIDLLELWANPAEGFGCQYHPNARAHQRFSNELVAFIRAHLPRDER